MTIHFQQSLGELKEKILAMASHAERAVSQAVKAVIERDDELARKIKEEDSVIDRFEIEVDELAIQLLAKAPLASDLRLITVGMKISHDLERVGDEATTIARRAQELCLEPQLDELEEIPRMAKLALQLLKDALDAFVRRDPARARDLIPKDKDVDRMNKEMARQLADGMVRRPDTIGRSLNLMVISKSIERIADHATNIAEEVVYLYEGQDIRHSGAGQTASSPASG